jgi:predicted RNA-binding Zn ribbon-like protein
VNFDYYTDEPVQLAVDLVNTYDPDADTDDLPDAAAVRELLASHDARAMVGVPELTLGEADLEGVLTVAEGDLEGVRALRSALRDVFTAPDERTAVVRLNRLLRRSGATPYISGHDAESFHMHFEPVRSGVVRWLGAVTAMGLAVVLCDYGFDRLGTCASPTCSDVFVDETKNRRKRYCSEGCAHRASVAAYRARRRKPAVEPSPPPS